LDCIGHTSKRKRGFTLAWLFAALLICGAVGVLIWRLSPDEKQSGAFVREDFEQQLGIEVARVVEQIAEPGSDLIVGVLRFSSRETGPYAEGDRALIDALYEQGHTLKTYDPGALQLGEDQPYTACLGRLIADCNPDIVVVLARGQIDKAPVTAEMERFVARGGRLAFLGELFEIDSPILTLIRRGAAVAVAHHAGILRHRAPEQRTLAARNADEYFRQYYTVLTAENLSQALPKKPSNANPE
jgi:hypothetical protein